MSKRSGWNGNEASSPERHAPIADYYRGLDGSLIHGPDCIPPAKFSPGWICSCDYIDPHEFTPHNPKLMPGDKSCHECGLLPDDPVHRPAVRRGVGNG